MEVKNYKDLFSLCDQYIHDSGVSIQAFCRKSHVSPAYYYAWRRGILRMSSKMASRIRNHLQDVYQTLDSFLPYL